MAARCGDWGRKRTLIRLCPRDVIKLLTTGESSCVQLVRVVSTTGPGREIDQSRTARDLTVLLRQPAMTEDVELEGWRTTQVRFERQSLLLFVPCAYKPTEGNRAWPQADRDLGIVEPVGSEAEPSLKKCNAQPVGVEDSSFGGARRFYPAKRQCTLATVVAGKVKEPRREQNCCSNRVDEDQSSQRNL